jgi:hypothetical protein
MSEVEFTDWARFRQFSVSAQVSGAPAIQARFPGAQEFDPQKIVVTFYRTDQEPWQLRSVQVSGRRVLKSGGLGKEIRTNYYYGLRSEVPDWVRRFVDEVTPGPGEQP